MDSIVGSLKNLIKLLLKSILTAASLSAFLSVVQP